MSELRFLSINIPGWSKKLHITKVSYMDLNITDTMVYGLLLGFMVYRLFSDWLLLSASSAAP